MGSLIKMTCRADGRLLQPSAPARAIDASFALEGGPVPRVANVHAIMTTYSDIPGEMEMRWAHALVIGLNNSFAPTPAHFGGDLRAGEHDHVAWWGYQPSAVSG